VFRSSRCASGGIRTHNPAREAGSKPAASSSSATPASEMAARGYPRAACRFYTMAGAWPPHFLELPLEKRAQIVESETGIPDGYCRSPMESVSSAGKGWQRQLPALNFCVDSGRAAHAFVDDAELATHGIVKPVLHGAATNAVLLFDSFVKLRRGELFFGNAEHKLSDRFTETPASPRISCGGLNCKAPALDEKRERCRRLLGQFHQGELHNGQRMLKLIPQCGEFTSVLKVDIDLHILRLKGDHNRTLRSTHNFREPEPSRNVSLFNRIIHNACNGSQLLTLVYRFKEVASNLVIHVRQQYETR
jgi:hypothetical protein